MTVLESSEIGCVAAAGVPGTETRRVGGFRARLLRRKWPILTSLLFLVVGIVYMLFWNVVVHGAASWATGGDLWGIYRGAHYVGWGDLAGVYSGGTGIVAFPGMAVLLAPVAMLTGHFSMSESYGPFFVPHPTAALVLQPLELILSSIVIFASDALAERLDVSPVRRLWLCVGVGIIAWPVAAVWGHAEDMLALSFALYAMVAMMNRKWSAAGWLFGFGIAVQPLVALLLPLLMATIPPGKRIAFAVRSSALSLVLVGLAFVGNASATYQAVVKQPTPPSVNHATPWAALAPRISTPVTQLVHGASLVAGLGHPGIKAITATAQSTVEVSGGAGRLLDVALAVLVGLFAWRRPRTWVQLMWLATFVLASRCFFEPVMTAYYLAPPLIMGLIMASRQSAKRFTAVVILSLELTVFAYHHLNPWAWWLPVIAGMTAVVALGCPISRVSSPDKFSEPVSTDASSVVAPSADDNPPDDRELVVSPDLLPRELVG